MERFMPSQEDFIPCTIRAACPICNEDMIHTRIEVDEVTAYHVWICSCEAQPDGIHDEIMHGRTMTPDTALVVYRE
jgi:hypothetical protein